MLLNLVGICWPNVERLETTATIAPIMVHWTWLDTRWFLWIKILPDPAS